MTTSTRSPRRTKTVDSILRARTGDRQPGTFYKVAANSPSLAIDTVSGQPRVDRAKMMATAVISTPTVDRVRDLLIPSGCKLDNYRKNPTVLFGHGFTDVKYPVGRSEDAAGNLTVRVGDAVEADCYFSQKYAEAAQIFELIDEGVIRATSVRETPIKSSYQRDPDFGEILIVDEWELEEWSWCCVGCNPDAIRKALDRGKLGGVAIVPSVLKSLIAVDPGLKRYGIGYGIDPAEEPDVKKWKQLTAAERKALKKADFAKLKADNPDDAAEIDTAEAEAAKAKPEVAETETETETEDTGKGVPYGAQVVSAMHAAIMSAVQAGSEAMGPLENPEVKAALTEILSVLGDQSTALEGLYSSSYPDQAGLKTEPASEDEAAEGMKAFLASGKLPQFQLAGIGQKLKGLVAAKNLTATQRADVNAVVSGLQRLTTQAKAWKPKPAEVVKPDPEEAQRKALQDRLDKAAATLNKLSATA